MLQLADMVPVGRGMIAAVVVTWGRRGMIAAASMAPVGKGMITEAHGAEGG